MSLHTCTVAWERGEQAFTDQRYSRAHDWRFDGGATVRGSSSPHSVRAPFSDPAAVDPEEAFVAAVSSCHMLWFLSLAAQRGLVVDSYVDAAEGRMTPIDGGERQAVTTVLLRPEVVFSGPAAVDDALLDELHHAAHERCFIANSIRSDVRVQGRWSRA